MITITNKIVHFPDITHVSEMYFKHFYVSYLQVTANTFDLSWQRWEKQFWSKEQLRQAE